MTVPPAHCIKCRHLRDTAPPTCAAFLDRIPDLIWIEGDPHTGPVAGDHGIRFEPKKEPPVNPSP
jgi:hypothetical protein